MVHRAWSADPSYRQSPPLAQSLRGQPRHAGRLPRAWKTRDAADALHPTAGTRPHPDTADRGPHFGKTVERLCLRLARLNAWRRNTVSCTASGYRSGRGHRPVHAEHRRRRLRRISVQAGGPVRIERHKNAVTAFRRGTWFGRASALYICTSNDRSKVHTAEELERQRRGHCDGRGSLLCCGTWVSCHASSRDEPLIVDDFFGRPWTSAFCGESAAAALGKRLDATAVVAFRRPGSGDFTRMFSMATTPGIPIPPQQERHRFRLESNTLFRMSWSRK